MNKPCRRIELDFDNESILRKFYPFLKTTKGIRLLEMESINECIRRARGDQPAQYKYLGTRYVYRIENEHDFMLLLIETGISYKEVNPNSYSLYDTGDYET